MKNSSAPPNDEAVSPSFFLVVVFSISHGVVLFVTKNRRLIHTHETFLREEE